MCHSDRVYTKMPRLSTIEPLLKFNSMDIAQVRIAVIYKLVTVLYIGALYSV